mmetsp:Transcript_21195/g.58987  ORF Transcript_21195/g.58987 Transcript_21195/m.58987 type:complete len:261 (+) Transcript_21195:616-1398(+)
MALRCEGTVSDLGGLEGDDHVGSRSEHGQVSSDGGGEGHLQPVVWSGVWEGGGEHLADRDVGGDVGEDGDDEDEPVDAVSLGHGLLASTHGEVEECLWNTGVVEGSDEQELSDEKHEESVVDLGEGGLGFGDELLVFWLDLVSIHVVGLLGWERVALGIVLGVLWAWIVVLTLVRGHDHEDGSSSDGDDADIKSVSEAAEENDADEDLESGPECPRGGFLLLWLAFVGGGLAGVVGVLLCEHLWRAVTHGDDANVLANSG